MAEARREDKTKRAGICAIPSPGKEEEGVCKTCIAGKPLPAITHSNCTPPQGGFSHYPKHTVYSPRLRYAGQPSLLRKEGEEAKFQIPLSAQRREGGRAKQ
jgi:hypothetical protein